MFSTLPEDGNIYLGSPRPQCQCCSVGASERGDASAFRLIGTLGSAGQDLVRRDFQTLMSFLGRHGKTMTTSLSLPAVK